MTHGPFVSTLMTVGFFRWFFPCKGYHRECHVFGEIRGVLMKGLYKSASPLIFQVGGWGIGFAMNVPKKKHHKKTGELIILNI